MTARAFSVAIASLFGPLVVVAAAVHVWGQAPDFALSPSAKGLEARMAKADARVVILGNSKVGTDIDLAALASALGLPAGSVVAQSDAGSRAPTWYAILDNRVYAKNYAPDLVIVYGWTRTLLATKPASEREDAALQAQLDGDDPVVEARVYGGKHHVWSRVRENGAAARDAFLTAIRDDVVGALFGGEGPARDRGHAVGEAAFEKLFAQESTSATRGHAVPVVETDETSTDRGDPAVADGFVPEFITLAQAHHSKIVFALSPLARSQAGLATVAPALERDLVELLNEGQAGWIDLRDLNLGESAFADGIHMNRTGQKALTAALAERLLAMGALKTDAFAAASLPVARPAVRVTRSGTPPELPPAAFVRGNGVCGWQMPTPKSVRAVADPAMLGLGLGLGSPLRLTEDGKPLKPHAGRKEFADTCAGAFAHQLAAIQMSPSDGPVDVVSSRTYALSLATELPTAGAQAAELAYWVYPGTQVEIAVDEAWSGADFGVEVTGRALGTGAATVSIGDVTVPIEVTGTRFVTTLPAPPPGGPWTVRIASPPGGPWLDLTSVAVGNAQDPWFVLGDPDAGALMSLLRAEPTYAAAAPAGPALPAPSVSKDGLTRIAVPGFPSNDAISAETGIGSCAPLRLAMDGAPLTTPSAPIPVIQKEGGGRYTFVKGSFVVKAPAGPHTWSATLEATRHCGRARWLYPGDSATTALTIAEVQHAHRALDTLELGARAWEIADDDRALTIRITSGETVIFEGSFTAAELRTTTEIALPTPIAPEAGPLAVSLQGGSGWTLLTTLLLTEHARAAFSP